MSFNEQFALMEEHIASGFYPPRSWGYFGVNLYNTNGNHFVDVLIAVSDYLANAEGVDNITHAPFEIRWEIEGTVFSAKVKTSFFEVFHLDLDCVSGSAQLYLDTVFPMVRNFLNNGLIRLPNPDVDVLVEEEWRENAIERLEGRFGVQPVAPAAFEEIGEVGEVEPL